MTFYLSMCPRIIQRKAGPEASLQWEAEQRCVCVCVFPDFQDFIDLFATYYLCDFKTNDLTSLFTSWHLALSKGFGSRETRDRLISPFCTRVVWGKSLCLMGPYFAQL